MFRFAAKLGTLRPALFAVLSAIVCQLPCFGQEQDDYLGERPECYAMVRVVEGKVKITKWDYDEELTIGTPVAEGDVIQSEGRGVIQLGDGTRIAFGGGTRLDIAALFDYRDGGAQALFRLDRGRIRLSAGPQSAAEIRIDTPAGSATLGARSNAYVEVGPDRSLTLRVFSGSVAFRNRADATSVLAGDSLVAYSDNDRLDRMRPFNTYQLNSFEDWAGRHLSLGRQTSGHIPREIRYYADALDGHGDWVDVAGVGWCWRPHAITAGWRPYWRGHWGPYRGGMTWVSYDPFGYVTHHYGRWGWSGMYGWYWIPGVYYSPAWVAWSIVDAFFGWAPLGYYNWPIYWGYGGWRHDCWIVIDYRHSHNRGMHNYSRWDNGMGRLFPAHEPNRATTPPWMQGPLVVTRSEFNNPSQGQLRRALTREVSAQRLGAYEAQAGRQVIVRRDAASKGTTSATGTTGIGGSVGALRPAGERPFEDRSTKRALEERPVLRETGARSRRDGAGAADAPGGRTASRDTDRDARRDTGRAIDRNTGRDADRDTGRDTGRDTDAGGRRPLPPPGDSYRNQDGRRPDAQAPSRPYGTREPNRDSSREPAPRSSGAREYDRPTPPPSRYDRPTPPPSRSEPTRAPEPTRSSPPPPSSSPSSPSSPSPNSYSPPPRTSAPPTSSAPASRPAPPPDRSRNSRR
jgi:hypothetical protein